MHHSSDLITLFNGCFSQSFNTVLEGGGDEPLYEPAAGARAYHRIIFRNDYFASALHEIAHWCVAGEKRRQRLDYGYWYEPDGRTQAQQSEFERVEVAPQALEWIFNVAAGTRFRVSADNLQTGCTASEEFKSNIALRAQRYCIEGLPARAQDFTEALTQFYQPNKSLCAANFNRTLLA